MSAMDEAPKPTITIVLMGVSGSGKSSACRALVTRLGWPSVEGDDLHPPANVAKMARGEPLDDADRRPWLAAIATWIGRREAAGHDALVTCSALKGAYRDRLRLGHPSVWFAHLVAPREVLATRMAARSGHFMPLALLDSQLATLEPLGSDEPGAAFPTDRSPAATAVAILARLHALGHLASP